MFKKAIKASHESPASKEEVPLIKYDRPKVLLVDVEAGVAQAIVQKGFNATTGSFGSPYKVGMSDGLSPIIINGELPATYAEQEVIIIDLKCDGELEGPDRKKASSMGSDDWWASNSAGVIDPRPRLMFHAQSVFDNIHGHESVFIIFASPRGRQEAVFGLVQLQEFRKKFDVPADNWSFLSKLNEQNLTTSSVYGEEITVKVAGDLGELLEEKASRSHFLCTINPSQSLAASWKTLATDKYGSPVAGVIIPKEKEGWVFIFPQLHDKAGFLTGFLKNVLPTFTPSIFPHAEGIGWINRREYEPQTVLELQKEVKDIEEEANRRITELEQRIQQEKFAHAFIYDLMRETGTPLVSAVKTALTMLGFTSIVDVDQEVYKPDQTSYYFEDLRIEDQSPTLLIEVKGVGGKPSDADSLQVQKNVVYWMRAWKRIDVQGLTIINHEKHLPPLERENNEPFREVIITNAEEQQIGLMTSWDLTRLVRSYLKNGWKPDHVKPIFYRIGRIEPIPEHYQYVGTVLDYWEKAGVVSIQIEEATLQLGDRLSFELPVEFEEQDVTSLQMDHEQVNEAGNGSVVALKTKLTKAQARKGMRVFRSNA